MTPLISILIPVYNREHIISETINCAVNQTYKNIEIIICDNCSTDNTWEILEEWAKKDCRIRIFKNEKNLGPVLNWKECFDKAKGEYAKILWSDDLISETFVECTLAVFEEDTAFVLTGYEVFRGAKTNIIHSVNYLGNERIKKINALKSFVIRNIYQLPNSPGCALFRTSDLTKAMEIEIPNSDNLIFKNLGAGNDLLLFLNTLSNDNYSHIKCVSSIESHYRSHATSISVANSSQLMIYYEWAKCYFLKKNGLLLNNYKAKLFIQKLANRPGITKNLYEELKGVNISIISLFNYLYLFLISKIQKK